MLASVQRRWEKKSTRSSSLASPAESMCELGEKESEHETIVLQGKRGGSYVGCPIGSGRSLFRAPGTAQVSSRKECIRSPLATRSAPGRWQSCHAEARGDQTRHRYRRPTS